MNVMRLLNLALQFTTRLPGWPIKNYSEKDLGQSGVFFPVIGLLVGAILYFEYRLLADVNVITATILIIITEILISGGLHLDGFMDTMDGVMSGASGDKMLTIMADSNVGAHSVSMLFVLLLAKIALLIELFQVQPLVVVLLPFVGRLLMILSIIVFPYPKKTGIGIIYKTHLNKSLVVFTAVVSLGIIVYIDAYYLAALLLTAASVYVFARSIVGKIHGLTGDTYGAIEEMSEVFFLLYIFIAYLMTGR